MNKSVQLLTLPLLSTLLFACAPPLVTETCSVEISTANSNSTITSATTWVNSGSGCDYLVKNDVSLGAVLTIEPGTVIQFEAGVRVRVSGGGTIVAVGSSGNRIVFRGKEQTKGYWRGLFFSVSGTNNVISFTTVRDAGSSATQQGAIEAVASRLTLSDSVVTNNALNGLFADGQTTDLTGFARNTFSANNLSGLRIQPKQLKYLDAASDYQGGNQPNARLWVSVDGGTLPTGDITSMIATRYRITDLLATGGSLTISAGAILEFEAAASFEINSAGTLTAVGTSASRIQIKGSTETAGFWRGLDIKSNTANRLEFVDLRHAGFAVDPQGAARIRANSTLTIKNSDFSNNAQWGIYRASSGTSTLNDDGSSTFSANALGNIGVGP